MANEKLLIDANALKAHINGVSTHWLNDWSTLGVLAAVDKQPTVDAVEVVHGRWALIEEGQNTSVYQCSKCKRMVNVVCDRNLRERQLAKNYPYCNCGAKMDGDGNG